MKLFLKIVFFILTILTTVGVVKSSTVVNAVQEETSCLVFQELQLPSVILKNAIWNTCQNKESLVTYNGGIGIKATAAKTGGKTFFEGAKYSDKALR